VGMQVEGNAGNCMGESYQGELGQVVLFELSLKEGMPREMDLQLWNRTRAFIARGSTHSKLDSNEAIL